METFLVSLCHLLFSKLCTESKQLLCNHVALTEKNIILQAMEVMQRARGHTFGCRLGCSRTYPFGSMAK